MAGSRFASGKRAFGFCDVCGFRYDLKLFKRLVIKTKNVNILACPTCWTPDQPQLQLGMYVVSDPQALRNPRPDTTYLQAGLTGLQVDDINPPDPTAQDAFGVPSGGSRVIQWGFAPVGGSRADDAGLTPNNLAVTAPFAVLFPVSVVLNGTVVTQTLMAAALNQASVGSQPAAALFRDTFVGGRRLGDIDGNGTVNSADAADMLRFVTGSTNPALTPDEISYITKVMFPYMLSNPNTYAAYLTNP